MIHDILPPEEIHPTLKAKQEAIDDYLFCVEWTLDTFISMPKAQRSRLQDHREALEMEAADIKDHIEMTKKFGRDW